MTLTVIFLKKVLKKRHNTKEYYKINTISLACPTHVLLHIPVVRVIKHLMHP
jgi:hypothetical protein